jgi:hypothetical protein
VGLTRRGQERLHVGPQLAGCRQPEQVVAQLQVGRGAARRQVRLQDAPRRVSARNNEESYCRSKKLMRADLLNLTAIGPE